MLLFQVFLLNYKKKEKKSIEYQFIWTSHFHSCYMFRNLKIIFTDCTIYSISTIRNALPLYVKSNFDQHLKLKSDHIMYSYAESQKMQIIDILLSVK